MGLSSQIYPERTERTNFSRGTWITGNPGTEASVPMGEKAEAMEGCHVGLLSEQKGRVYIVTA